MLDISPHPKSNQKAMSISASFNINPSNKGAVNSETTHPLNKQASDTCALESKVIKKSAKKNQELINVFKNI